MQIYGIDVSKSYLDIYSQSKDKKVLTKRIPNKLKAIVKFLSTISSDSVLCAEFTGVYSDLIVQIANCSNVQIALIEGYVIHKSFSMEKGKSDQIDSKRIWSYGMRFYDKLRFIIPLSEDLQELKQLLNCRSQLVKQRKALKITIKRQENQTMNSVTVNNINSKFMDEFSEQIEELERQMKLIIENNVELSKNYQLACSVIGIGQVTALEMIIYTNNFSKINTARKAASFAGVCPFPHESGNMSRKPRVHHRSNKKIKSLLYMAALNACTFNKEFKAYRERKIAEGKHFFLAMNNVANKLLRTLFAVIKSGRPYDPNYICLDPRKK